MCLPSYSSSPLLPPPISTLFPYTTLFRSPARGARGCPATRAARFGPCGVAGVPGPRRLRQPHSSCPVLSSPPPVSGLQHTRGPGAGPVPSLGAAVVGVRDLPAADCEDVVEVHDIDGPGTSGRTSPWRMTTAPRWVTSTGTAGSVVPDSYPTASSPVTALSTRSCSPVRR